MQPLIKPICGHLILMSLSQHCTKLYRQFTEWNRDYDLHYLLFVAGCPLQLEELEKLENELFSEFGWKSWKIIGFSPDLAGKAGMLFWAYNNQQHYQMKVILSRNSSKEEKIVQYYMAQIFFHRVDPGLKVFPIFCQVWLVDPYPPWVVNRKTLNLCRKQSC